MKLLFGIQKTLRSEIQLKKNTKHTIKKKYAIINVHAIKERLKDYTKHWNCQQSNLEICMN